MWKPNQLASLTFSFNFTTGKELGVSLIAEKDVKNVNT